jgi:hypothetical protein
MVSPAHAILIGTEPAPGPEGPSLVGREIRMAAYRYEQDSLVRLLSETVVVGDGAELTFGPLELDFDDYTLTIRPTSDVLNWDFEAVTKLAFDLAGNRPRDAVVRDVSVASNSGIGGAITRWSAYNIFGLRLDVTRGWFTGDDPELVYDIALRGCPR